MILGGANIGHHSVIAAGTVVRAGEIPPYSLVAGSPMQIKAGYYTNLAAEAAKVKLGRKKN